MDALSDKKKSQVNIVVIDSGINTSISDLGSYVKKSTGFRLNEHGVVVEEVGMQAKSEHGSAVALIIRFLCPEARFLSVNIFGNEKSADGRVLLHAFRQAVAYKPDIINLSLGTTRIRYLFPFERALKTALDCGIVVVAAAGNDGRKSYPAYLKGTIGVKSINTEDEDYLHYKNGFYYAPHGFSNVTGADELRTTAGGNSTAAAYMTGYIGSLMIHRGHNSRNEILKELKAEADKNPIKIS